MTSAQIFTSRLRGRPLVDKEDLTIGRIRDVVLLPSARADPPRALGLVVTLQRRRIFVNLGQVTEISVDGAHLPGGSVELERFSRKTGEILASELYGRHTADGTIVDVAISPSERRRDGWEVSALALSHGRSLLGGPRVVPWNKYPELFRADPLTEELAGLRELQPADLASAVEGLSPSRRDQIASALNDEELADLLEEMPEKDQIRLLASLSIDRSADVVEEMQPDDAADLRRLLRYDATTAGGMMTSQPLIVSPETPVAEMLARIMDREVPATSAAQVYVCEPPLITPTGRYLGSIGFQRLLRRPPSALAGQCVEASFFVRPELTERELAARLAAYNLVSVAVCDENGRLVGAVTVDDVLDHLLPADWRKKTGG
jgi:CBS domain-containing protein